MPVKESQAATEARWYCWVTRRRCSHHHSLSLQTWKHQQLNNREADPPNTWLTELQSRTPPGAPLVTDPLICRGGPQPVGALYVPEWAELWRNTAQTGLLIASYKRLKKRLWEGHNSCGGGSLCLCTLVMPGSPQAKQLHLLHTQLSLGQSCHRQKCLESIRVVSVVSNSLWPRRLWPASASLSGGFLRQEHWSELANAGCHTLLEHYTSCCPSCHLPWVPGAARAPGTQAAAPPPYLALTGANPSPPGQPQKQTPEDAPHAEVEIKPQLKSRGSVAKEEDPKPSHQLYKLQIKSTWSTGQLYVFGIYKRTLRTPTK